MQQTERAKLEYGELVKQASPDSKIVSNCIKAFCVGGGICCFGQLISNILANAGYAKSETSMYTSVILITIASILTGFGIYDRFGKFAGAGSVVPITGFSNSVTAPALEFKKEGFVLGVGAKMFVIAGPVILYGVIASIIVGAVYYFVGR